MITTKVINKGSIMDFLSFLLYTRTSPFVDKSLEKGGDCMNGYMLVWILLQEIERLNEELKKYQDNQNKN